MIGVEDNRHAIDGGNAADIVGTGDGTGDGSLSLLGAVLDALAGEVGAATLGGLEDDRGLGVAGSLKGGNTVEHRSLAKAALSSRYPAKQRPAVRGVLRITYTVDDDVTLMAGMAKPFF